MWLQKIKSKLSLLMLRYLILVQLKNSLILKNRVNLSFTDVQKNWKKPRVLNISVKNSVILTNFFSKIIKNPGTIDFIYY